MEILHAGKRIKEEVIPAGMTVSTAARLIGVGRPALSNLLNGKAALSPEMATRLEKAFSYPREALLDMQAAYDAAQAAKKIAPADTKQYVPPFLSIKANQIEQWAEHNIPARMRLAVLLRTLVHSTGRALAKVDFPGNDDAERPGWDGFVEADEGTPWVPSGTSGWEFGVNEDIKKKADGDFEKSLKALQDESSRKEITFVFVTPRHWPGKDAWVKTAAAKGLWKDIRAYDSSDLEQWIEQSLPAQAWFANEAHLPVSNVRSLDKCWKDWADVADPPLTGTLFDPAIAAAKRTIQPRLSSPPDGPTVIVADSTGEALAFLAQVFGERGGEELATYRDRVIVFDKPGVLPRLAEGTQSFIPVVFTREAERELAPLARSVHSIVIYPRNALNTEPHIVLEPVGHGTFESAMREMGKDRDETNRLAKESGRSLTVLRRRLATVPAVQTPEWEADPHTAESLIPFMLVGAWRSDNSTDTTALSMLAGDKPYEDLEREFQKALQLNDAPVWSIGEHRGVISKIDVLYAIGGSVTREDLTHFFDMARLVLSEDDPALDLDDDKRWAAAMYGKSREFSEAFREGIAETLVLLAVHGRQLFKQRLGIDTEGEAARVVRELLPTPLTTRALKANDRDLPTYAEAAPDEFLSILERDLKSDDPAVLGLLHPVNPAVFGLSPSRTGLLWALEGLCWNPETLPRAALILARLAQVEINDNWMNKPIESLKSVFRAWMPQTAADLEARVALMKKLAECFPDTAWKVCMAQFGSHHEIGDYSHKPRWRPDGYGFGEPVSTWGPILEFKREMVEMALGWNKHTLSTLSDLVSRLHDLDVTDQERVWKLIENWAKAEASDSDKAMLREQIRVSTLSRVARLRSEKHKKSNDLAVMGKAAYQALEPRDLLNRHAWLFREVWIDESADELEEVEKIDFRKREERIETLRIKALQEIHQHRGLAGLLEMCDRCKTAGMIGMLAASHVLSESEVSELLRLALTANVEREAEGDSYQSLITGVLYSISDNGKREAVINDITSGQPEEVKVRLLVLAPYRKSTWMLVDEMTPAAQAKYWIEVNPEWIRDSDAEHVESVERLLAAGRPRAAFYCVRFELEQLDTQVLYRLLTEVAQSGNESSDHYLPDSYHIQEAFKHIDESSGLTLDQRAGLEFMYLGVLTRPIASQDGRSGIPNLERYIEQHPAQFVHALTWVYKRSDGNADPDEYQIPPDRKQRMAELGDTLLQALRRIPGHDDVGDLRADRLAAWIGAVREGSKQVARTDIADHRLGLLLAHAPVGIDGVWPCEPVRQIMEAVSSEAMMRGALIGVYNSRGVHSRGEGGDQERELAKKYRDWGRALQVSHPFVASKLLAELARTYEREASREDQAAGIRRRLR